MHVALVGQDRADIERRLRAEGDDVDLDELVDPWLSRPAAMKISARPVSRKKVA